MHPPRMYVTTLLLLLALMALTVWASMWHIGDLQLGPITIHGTIIKNVVALSIAMLKASLVLAFFMGIKFATKLTKLWAGAGFVAFMMLFLALGDYGTRKYEPTPRWTGDPGSALMRSVNEARTSEESRSLEPGGRGR